MHVGTPTGAASKDICRETLWEWARYGPKSNSVYSSQYTATGLVNIDRCHRAGDYKPPSLLSSRSSCSN
jgi:hypothetical protein